MLLDVLNCIWGPHFWLHFLLPHQICFSYLETCRGHLRNNCCVVVRPVDGSVEHITTKVQIGICLLFSVQLPQSQHNHKSIIILSQRSLSLVYSAALYSVPSFVLCWCALLILSRRRFTCWQYYTSSCFFCLAWRVEILNQCLIFLSFMVDNLMDPFHNRS